MTVEIYWGSGSPYAWRVLLAAELKRIPYESKLLEFSKGDLKKPEYLALKPLGTVGRWIFSDKPRTAEVDEARTKAAEEIGRFNERVARGWLVGDSPTA